MYIKKETSKLFPPVRQPFPLDERMSLDVSYLGANTSVRVLFTVLMTASSFPLAHYKNHLLVKLWVSNVYGAYALQKQNEETI